MILGKLKKHIAGGAKPEFRETDLNFITLLPLAETTAQVTAQVTADVAAFCSEPRSAKEIMAKLGLKHLKTFQTNYLISSGLIPL